jgi:phosphoribosyl 1,2-cyclic phosphodiesterase
MDEQQNSESMEITFYGVRGSLPAPLRPQEIEAQMAAALLQASEAGARFSSLEAAQEWLVANLPLHQRGGYGGDTTSFLVRCGNTRLIVDAGSGIRRLGRDLMPELFRTGKLELSLLFTHMHLDHIMGFPFFAPLFAPKRRFSVNLSIHGGAAWRAELQTVLAATVGPPVFPVELEQLRAEAASIEYHPVYDGLTVTLGDAGDVTAHCRRLHHPNETYGWRIEYGGKAFVVATDTEPYAGPDLGLAELAANADVLYVDAQFDRAQYVGEYDRLSRVGWGHGYAEWCAEYASDAGARLAVMGHHDPASGPQRIYEIGEAMRAGMPNTVVGFDGLRVRVTDGEIVAANAGERGKDLRFKR